ncbi:hypothetical protein ABEB36_000275 [Hypothenemus hampei]|uniref:Uncharacterized protein n=1 Tax=Hypothenemus hampei TaxID=57062 RepID=A0ABD1FDW2_HYPHA
MDKCDMCVFDMMNVIIPVANSRNRVNAYEFAVDEQNVLFDKMTSFVENMQMIGGGKDELPFRFHILSVPFNLINRNISRKPILDTRSKPTASLVNQCLVWLAR